MLFVIKNKMFKFLKVGSKHCFFHKITNAFYRCTNKIFHKHNLNIITTKIEYFVGKNKIVQDICKKAQRLLINNDSTI